MTATGLLEEYSLPWAVSLSTVATKRSDQGKILWRQNSKDLTLTRTVSQKWICFTGPVEWNMEYSLELYPFCCLSFLLFFQTGIFILATLFFLHCCILDRLEIAKLVYCPQDSKSGISYLTWEKDISSKALGPVSRCNTWWYFEIPTGRSSECICDYMQTHYFI